MPNFIGHFDKIVMLWPYKLTILVKKPTSPQEKSLEKDLKRISPQKQFAPNHCFSPIRMLLEYFSSIDKSLSIMPPMSQVISTIIKPVDHGSSLL